MSNQEKCPVCGNEEYESIDVSGASSDASICIHRKGSVELICCTKCGVVRVSKRSLEFRLKH